MTPEQREAAERLVADQSSSNLEWSRQVIALLRGLLAEPQGEPVQEPVAWIHRAQYLLAHAENSPPADKMLENGWEPLYAAPQQPMRCPKDGGECGAGGYCRPEPVQRRPLSDAFVYKVVRSVQPNLADTCKAWAEQFYECKYWLDAAHGITGEPT